MKQAKAQTLIPTAQAETLLGMFVTHIKEDHGLTVQIEEDGTHIVDEQAFRIAFGATPSGLSVDLVTPNESTLLFFKEEIVAHVAEVDEHAATNIRWDDDAASAGELPGNFRVLRVLDSFILFTGMQRVILSYPGIATHAHDGAHLRLMLPAKAGRRPVWPVMGDNGVPIWPQGDDVLHARFITIKDINVEAETVSLDIVRHDHGFISQWAQNVKTGDDVGAMGPAGMLELPEATSYFLAADGTGLPCIARFLETLDPNARGNVVVAAPQEYDLSDYLPATNLDIHKVAPGLFEGRIAELAQQLTKPGLTDYAFFAGEFQNAQELRKYFKKVLNLDKKTQISATYWRRGMPGAAG
ncbi:MAG: siderophore-interacting protein [Pseudomonadota bacterium]